MKIKELIELLADFDEESELKFLNASGIYESVDYVSDVGEFVVLQ